ncbi:sugar O-acetyltransferase [Chryseobacterium caseinilyticum]|uniref:Acetyltransferase n=1 Tax=Chryseobacterium caseinilyticum TaxID=2771428 RepID=A0ABR8ZCB3_9FLAO|nr:sugar O-acetyltransferase [Chryseobacterium caseinilyticum]MBD8082540.1 sugar O-acetyltransferase [Chryseobacterium caseinilyticum]
MNNLNEKEKMLSGEMYDATDELLVQERNLCKDLCFEYNQLRPSKIEERKALIKNLFGRTADNFHVEQPFYCDYGYNIEIGENFYTNVNVVIIDCAKVTFGDNVFIAPNCGFYTAGHPFDVLERNKALEYAYPITVGNNVWIGAGCSILPGVTIGDNTVIGAGSVVTKDIPANVLAVGNPCKVIREIRDL